MTALFVACFTLGLLLAVYVMLNGVERPGAPSAGAPHELGSAYDQGVEPSPVANAQNVAAFVTMFGVAGYLVQRFTTLGQGAAVAVAALAGVAGAALSLVLLAKWALPGARAEHVDERYLLQGHPATVVDAIPGDGEGSGEIAYEADGRRWTVRARSWDGTPLAAGTEVAIERVEDGIAYVEQWAQVETRL